MQLETASAFLKRSSARRALEIVGLVLTVIGLPDLAAAAGAEPHLRVVLDKAEDSAAATA